MATTPRRFFFGKGIGLTCMAVVVLAPGPRMPADVVHPSRELTWPGGKGSWVQFFGSAMPIAPLAPPAVWIDGNNPIPSIVTLNAEAVICSLAIDDDDTLRVVDNGSLWIAAPLSVSILANSGTLAIDGSEANATLAIADDTTCVLSGSGEIALGHAGTCRILGGAHNSVLLNDGSSIRGAGTIGSDFLQFRNNGVVAADVPFSMLTIVPGTMVQNTGVMKAANSGVLRLSAGLYDNADGVIRAENASYVDLANATIRGGSLESIGNGVLRVAAGTTTLDGVTLSGHFELDLASLWLAGTITNHGIVHVIAGDSLLPDPASFAEIIVPSFVNPVVLNGHGMLELNMCKIDAGSSLVGGTLVNGDQHTIRGNGLIGCDAVGFVNHGTLLADHDNPIVIDPVNSTPVVNDGLMVATGEGGLIFNGGAFRNDGALEVGPGSRIIYTATSTEANLGAGMLLNGTWRVIAGDQTALLLMPFPAINFNFADVTLSGANSTFAQINSMVMNAGRFAIENGRSFNAQGTFFSNEGTLEIGAGCQFTCSNFFSQGPTGTLKIEMSGSGAEASNGGLIVNGIAMLSGTLRVSLAPNFHPMLGESFVIVHASALQGNFDAVQLPPFMTAAIVGNELHIIMTGSCTGDLDQSGSVDVADLLALVSQWGLCTASPGDCPADVDQDGQVSVSDLLQVLMDWGLCRPGKP